jgi:exonuclease III
VYNCDGVPSPARDPANIKFDSIVSAARGGSDSTSSFATSSDAACDVVVLLETRTSHVTSRLQYLLPEYKFFTYNPHTEGLKGQGVAVLVHERIADFVSLWEVSEGLQAVWLKIQGHVFGVQGHVLFGGVYIPPQSQVHTPSDLEDWYTTLNTDVHRGLMECAHAYVVGDFNAHLGNRSEFTHEHFDLQDRFQELSISRIVSRGPTTPNLSGKLLMDVAGSVPLVLWARSHAVTPPALSTS